MAGSVKIKYIFLIFGVTLILSCSDSENLGGGMSTQKNKMKVISLSKLSSGYELSSENWKAFLRCWDSKQTNELYAKDDQRVVFQFDFEKRSKKSQAYDKELVEKNLGIKLPPSLNDFYSAFYDLKGVFIKHGAESSVGIFSPLEVMPLKEYSLELIDIEREWAVDSPDNEYYVYGIEQDPLPGRFSYFSESLVIGKVGFSSYELILMYPTSKTIDGEMEFAILSHAYEFRAPSFAEMMKQISFLYTKDKDTMPPYAQSELKGSCADLLPLENIWWK